MIEGVGLLVSVRVRLDETGRARPVAVPRRRLETAFCRALSVFFDVLQGPASLALRKPCSCNVRVSVLFLREIIEFALSYSAAHFLTTPWHS